MDLKVRYYCRQYLLPKVSKQTLKTMKLIAVILFAACLQVSARGYSQITLSETNTPLQKVFQKIQQQSGYDFVSTYETLKEAGNVTVKVQNVSLQKALEECLKGKPLTYVIIGKTVVVQPEEKVKGYYNASAIVVPETLIPPPIEIHGRVVNEQGQPLQNVSVLIAGTKIGTTTGSDGRFTLTAPDNKNVILEVSSVGFQSKRVNVGKQTEINVVLETDIAALSDVVVIGYGSQKKVSLTGSVATVDAEFLKDRPLTNASQGLQGVQGVFVNQSGGQPGADNATIRIRGVGTLNNNDPLVLVDGVEYNLSDVNPNDIKSISVLKDASSAAIYGSRAANGVILITTKSGKKGKMQVDYNYYFGLQQATYLPDEVTNSADWMVARIQASINEGQPPPFTDQQIDSFRTGTNPDLYPNTNWMDLMFREEPIQKHNLRVSGGNDQVTYSVSLGYLTQKGVLLATDAKSYSLNSKINFNISKDLKAGVSLSSTRWNRNEPPNGITGFMSAVTRALPVDPGILSNGSYGDTWLTIPGHNVFRNPLALAENGYLNNKTQRSLVHLSIGYTFPFNIEYKANAAVEIYDGLESRFIPEIYIYNPRQIDVPKVLRYDPPQRSAQRTDNNNLNTTFYQTLDWKKNIADRHQVNLLLGQSIETFSSSNFLSYIEGFFGNQLTELNAGTINKNVRGTSSKSRIMSFFGRANYSFADKYLLEIDFRSDGSSRFAEGNRWGFFPAFSLGWRIDQEAFMRNMKTISNLKLRASWGQLGNQNVPLYSYENTVALGQGYSFNNNVVPGAAVTTLADPRISWETTTISDIGLDLGLLNNKLIITADVFDKKTTNILARINIPAQVGNLAGPVKNLYSMSNKGIELGINYVNSIGDLNYNMGIDVTYIKNKVDFLNADIQYGSNMFGSVTIIQEGYTVNSYYLLQSMGLFQTQAEIDKHVYQGPTTAPGDIIYRDVNGDGVIDDKDKIVTGNSVPKYTYSFNFGLKFRGFDFAAFFQGVSGIDIYPIHNLSFANNNGAGMTKDQLKNSWTPDNPNASYPRLTLPQRGSGANYRNSTFWLRNSSYLRLKNLQLGYTISSELLNRIKIHNLRIYANAQDLLTFSPYKISDPEKSIISNPSSASYPTTVFDYPNVKIVSLGINIVF